MQYLGGYLEYRGGITINVGDILSTAGCSVPWGISWVPWRVILSSVGILSLVEGYHDARVDIMSTGGRGYSVPVGGGGIFCFLSTPTVLMISPTCIMIAPYGTEITKDSILPRYWTRPRHSRYPPTCIMITPTVLNTLHGTAHTLYRVTKGAWDGAILIREYSNLDEMFRLCLNFSSDEYTSFTSSEISSHACFKLQTYQNSPNHPNVWNLTFPMTLILPKITTIKALLDILCEAPRGGRRR